MESRRKRRNTQTTPVTQFTEATTDALMPAVIPEPVTPAVSNLEQGGPSSGPTAPDIPEGEVLFSGGGEERDAEMEDELANELTGDPLADYDIDVTKEGEALSEYVALLNSVMGQSL